MDVIKKARYRVISLTGISSNEFDAATHDKAIERAKNWLRISADILRKQGVNKVYLVKVKEIKSFDVPSS